jgi:hypothetical protein
MVLLKRVGAEMKIEFLMDIGYASINADSSEVASVSLKDNKEDGEHGLLTAVLPPWSPPIMCNFDDRGRTACPLTH